MNSLKDYGDFFLRLGLSELSVEDGNFRLQIKKEVNNEQPTVATQQSITEKDTAGQEVKDEKDISGTAVKAPLLGILYAKVGERHPYKEGDSIKAGDVLCTIEAMKMMNEVKSPQDGVIKKICAEDGALVEYNQVLFIIE